MMTRMGRLRDREIVSDVDATIAHLRRLPDARVGDLAVLGFCMGGRVTYMLRRGAPGRLAGGRRLLRRQHHEAVGRHAHAVRPHA